MGREDVVESRVPAEAATTAPPNEQGCHESRSPGVAAVVAVASIITVAFLGSVLITPLYSLYQHKFGFSDITLTLIYAVYVVGNMAALLLFGQISDQVGRKRVALAALGVAALGALVFLFAHSTAELFGGRLLIGLAVGIASGTATAWLAELYGGSRRAAATLTAATANLSGIALGPLLGGCSRSTRRGRSCCPSSPTSSSWRWSRSPSRAPRKPARSASTGCVSCGCTHVSASPATGSARSPPPPSPVSSPSRWAVCTSRSSPAS